MSGGRGRIGGENFGADQQQVEILWPIEIVWKVRLNILVRKYQPTPTGVTIQMPSSGRQLPQTHPHPIDSL